tara:strand:+ start:526 stop:702 length:177 start_codon:yes stop_codon:yes gene_type:complete
MADNSLAIIQLYKQLYKDGKISNSGVERHNELAEKYKTKLRSASDSGGYKRADRIQLL